MLPRKKIVMFLDLSQVSKCCPAKIIVCKIYLKSSFEMFPRKKNRMQNLSQVKFRNVSPQKKSCAKLISSQVSKSFPAKKSSAPAKDRISPLPTVKTSKPAEGCVGDLLQLF